jgi:hypothetical protein
MLGMAHCLVLPEKPGAWGRCHVVDLAAVLVVVFRLEKLEARKYSMEEEEVPELPGEFQCEVLTMPVTG